MITVEGCKLSNRRNRYSEEFKADAVRLVQEGRSVTSVAKDLGVNHQSLRNWIAEEKVSKDPIQSRILELEAELRSERKRNKELEESVSILKKATAIFLTNDRK